MFLSFASSSIHTMYASHIWSSDRLGLPHPPAWSSCKVVMLCWPLIIMNLPTLIASHEVGDSFRSALFSSTGVRHTFCSCLMSPIWTRVFFMSSTNDLWSVRMIKSSRAMMHWLMCTLVAFVSNRSTPCGFARTLSECWRISRSPLRVGRTWRSQSAQWSRQRLLVPLPPSSLGQLACFSSECPLRCPLIGQGFSFGPLLLKSQDRILLFLSLALCPRVQRLRAAVICPSLQRQPSPQLR